MSNEVIRVENVSKHARGRALIRDVSFTVHANELITLVGPNGAGKSTLIKIILGLDANFTGKVWVNPKEGIQYIPQIVTDDRTQLPVSVHEYLSIGVTPLYRLIKTPVDFTAALAHVGVKAEKLLQPFHSLSGGERQRVAIARALLTEPTTLVLDEPLAAVDHASRRGLYELIRHLQQVHDMTVLLVSHDIDSVLPLSDRMLCLNTTLRTDCHPTEIPATFNNLPRVHHHC